MLCDNEVNAGLTQQLRFHQIAAYVGVEHSLKKPKRREKNKSEWFRNRYTILLPVGQSQFKTTKKKN